MESILRSWGNSQGVYIPKEFMKKLDISVNDKLIMKLDDDRIVISKDNSNSLRERALDNLKKLREDNIINGVEALSENAASGNASDTAADIGAGSRDYRKIYEDYLDERYGNNK